MFIRFLLFLPLIYCSTIMIGDSLFANDLIKNQLEEWGNTQIDNLALIGSQFHEGWIESIPSQYFNYIKSNSIPDTIIMNGGGNDILSRKTDCISFNKNCIKRINEITSILDLFFKRINNDGVLNVIYLGPYYLQKLEKTINYGTDKISEICQKAELNCNFVDIRNKTIPLSIDNLHPNDDGYILLADELWNEILINDIIL